MKRIILAVVLFVLAACVSDAQTKEIIGYYPSWKWRSPQCLMTPDKIPFDKLTKINYAFFYPLQDGRLVGRDTAGDALILRGNAGEGLTSLAHSHGVRVLLSVGGWEDSNNFPEVAARSDGRINFAHSCAELIRKYGFDGIDIDWEYPGYADHGGTSTDRENFTRLLRTVRDSLDCLGKISGNRLLLMAALPAYGPNLSNFAIDSLVTLLDEFNVMTYDFNGPWDSLSGHNAPLYAPRDNDTLRNIDASFRYFTQVLHVPAEKINLGVPFYGHAYANCTALYASHSGVDTTHFPSQGLFYYDVAPILNDCRRVWDEQAQVPYLICDRWKTLVSYDDARSAAAKASYVRTHDAGGLIIWEITGDYLPDGSDPLLDAIYAQFHPSLPK